MSTIRAMPANSTRLTVALGALVGLVAALAFLVLDAPLATARTNRVAAPASAQQAAPAVQPAAPATGKFAFLAMDGDRPVRYDPCTPIHYVVNLSQAPADALDEIAGAIAQVSAATGLTFVYDGDSGEIPAAHRGLAKDPAFRGWPPVLIAWVQPDQTDLFSDGAIGEGGSTWYGAPGHEVYVTGVVAVDATQNAKLQQGFGGNSVGALLMHELGHVVGLDHVADPTQIMYATVTGKPAAWGDGDLAGLHQLGKQAGCVKTPNPPWTH